MDDLIARKVLEEFNRDDINYCVLRNYEDFEKEKDMDILIAKSDGFRVKKILKGLNLVQGFKSDNRFDIKVGCIGYNGRCIIKAEDVLHEKQGYKYFYILSNKFLLIHLIIKSLSYKEKGKRYIPQIESLLKSQDSEIIKREFTNLFGLEGANVFQLIKEGEYEEARKSTELLQESIKMKFPRFRYLFYRTWFPCLKRRFIKNKNGK